jgi:CO/xanthine dehydrogenase FAD-binding subunit
VAGATDFYPARADAPPDEDVLDLSALPGPRAPHRDGAGWVIPAATTWAALRDTPLPPLFDGLRAAAARIGGAQVQNVATVAGNVCNASPAADGLPCLLALDAAVELASAGGRRVLPLAEFVTGPRATLRRPDEMVTALRIPARPGRGVFRKLGLRSHLVISIVSVAVCAEAEAGLLRRVRVAVGACSPVPLRLGPVEAALEGHPADPALVRPGDFSALSPIDDVRASASYRLRAAVEMVRRAVAELA